MYICFGSLKGRKLLLPKSADLASLQYPLRPTTDFVKSVLFNIIMHDGGTLLTHPLEDAVVADFCCGTGAVGFEFISLGAKKCYFFDNNVSLLKNVKHNAIALKQQDKVQAIVTDVVKIRKIPEKINLAFFDPPYEAAWIIKNCLRNMAANPDILHDGALIITETKTGTEIKIPDQFKLLRVRQATSQIALSFYRFCPVQIN